MVDYITTLNNKDYFLIKNNPKYWDFVRELRSNDLVQDGFVENVKITKDQQIKYMQKHNDEYYICLKKMDRITIPVGFVGSVDDDIRVCVHPHYQGEGLGKFMVNELMKLYPNSYAKIKHDNIASNKLFQSCGFKKYDEDSKFYYYKK